MALIVLAGRGQASESAQPVPLGTLSCSSKTLENVTPPKLTGLTCRFVPVGSATPRQYVGDIIHSGPRIVLDAGEPLRWSVFGDEASGSPDPLLGAYHRLQPEIAASEGPSTQTLIGGVDETIMLEPVLTPTSSEKVLPVLQVHELELRPARI